MLSSLGSGVAADVRGRWPHVADDWRRGCTRRVLAPSCYIFCASVLPALAFGQQLAVETEGSLNVVHVLVATALSGVVQAVFGGQPLLIIGVAEPIVLIYGFLYAFAAAAPGLGTRRFLPWAAWVCVWTAALTGGAALANAARCIGLFTRLSGETFGALIAILFLQVAVKGAVHEFHPPERGPPEPWAALLTLVNGLFSLLLALGLLLSSMRLRQARSWLLGRAWLRGGLADYGVPLMVIAWSALSFACTPAPGVPRRVQTPNTWQVRDSWSVAARMGEVPPAYIAAALLPAAIITVLFVFDHSVSAQMAQQPEFNLVKPSAYSYDLLLLALLTLACGLLGLPPVNGVLPQAPIHTRSLARIRKRVLPEQHSKWEPAEGAGSACSLPVQPAPPPAGNDSALHAGDSAAGGQLPVGREVGRLAGALSQLHLGGVPPQAAPAAAAGLEARRSGELRHRSPHPPASLAAEQQRSPRGHEAAAQQRGQQRGRQLHPSGSDIQLNALPDSSSTNNEVLLVQQRPQQQQAQQQTQPQQPAEGECLALEVLEQRVSNLLQALAVGCCLGLTAAIKLIPTGVLWGYFALLSLEGLTGSQFVDRLRLLLTDPRKRVAVLQQEHAAYLQVVPFRVVVRFTLLQAACLAGVWALVTWAGIAGVAFPLPIMALVPLRQHVLPRLFQPQHLTALDAAAYEQAAAVPDPLQAAQELYALGAIAEPPAAPLPVHGDAVGGGGGGGGGSLAEDEAEALSREFHGLQLKHHLTRASLEARQQ